MRELLQQLSPSALEATLSRVLPSSALFRYRFVDVAKRFGLLRRHSDLRDAAVKRLVEAHANSPIWREAMAEALTEKLDLPQSKHLASLVNSRAVRVTLVSRPKLSPLAREFLEFYSARELLAPAEPTDALLEAFKRNLLGQKTEFHCNYCRHSFSRINKELGSALKCPNCGGTQLTLAEYSQVLGKNVEKLSPQERKQVAEARTIESLFSSYGGRAAVALATYGVGAETAARVLSRLHKTDGEFFLDLLGAQKNFVRTRRFWRA